MGKKSAPPPPDYVGAAQQQGQSNLEATAAQTWANRPNINTPWGQMTWNAQAGTDPATGQAITNWTGNVQLTPEQQQALDAQMQVQNRRSQFGLGLMDNAEQALSQPMNWAAMENGSVDPQMFVNLGTRFNGNAAPRNMNAAQMGPLASGVQGGSLRQTLSGQRQQTRGSAGYGDIQDRLSSDPSQVRSMAQSAVEQLQAPELRQRRAAVETQLANQGITQGSEAYQNAMRDVNDAESRAQLMAIAAGRDEAAQMFGQDLQAGQFANQAQGQGFGQDFTNAQLANALNSQEWNQGFGEANLWNQTQNQEFGQGMQNAGLQNSAAMQQYAAQMGGMQFENQAQQQQFQNLLTQAQQGNSEAQQIMNMFMQGQQFNTQNRASNAQFATAQRTQGLNELNAFLTGQQVQMPQFFNFNQAGRANPGDISGAINQDYQNQLGAWGSQNAQNSQLASSAISAIAAYFSMSDRRLKKDIKYLFTLENGIKVYKYRMLGKNQPEIGVIAQEVQEIMPEAVHKDARSGFFMVDYSKVLA